MTLLRVWAPNAASVQVQVRPPPLPQAGPALDLAWHDVAMLGPESGGWWQAEVEEAGPGTDYLYRLDGAPGLPDPRSPWQPQGVDGPSRLVGDFEWTDAGWRGIHLPSAVIYELHVGTFSPRGDFDGVVEHLDHLVALGVDAVELMPVAEFPGERGWGYDGVDLYAPHHAYGGPAGLARLVDACHARGLAVVMDVVFNHLGPAGNYLGHFGPYFTDFYTTPWGQAINLDGPGSDEVRAFLVDNALHWLEDYHCDGLRLDAVHAIVDTSATHLLEEVAARVHQLAGHLGRSLFVIAESDLNDPRLVRSTEAGGYGLDAAWSDDFHHALHVALTGERQGYYADFWGLADLAAALRHTYVYVGQHSRYRGRRHGRAATGLPASRFLGYSQNHDQVGNRALGERSSALLSEGRLRVATGLVLTAPFVPLLFQGEEWGASTAFRYFTSHSDPELGQAVREGRRREFEAFGWDPDLIPDPQDPSTFLSSQLDWSELATPAHSRQLSWVQELVRLRKAVPALTDTRPGQVRTAVDDDAGWLVMARGDVAAGEVVVAANIGPARARLDLPGLVGPAGARALLAASEAGVALSGHHLELPPDSLAVVGPG